MSFRRIPFQFSSTDPVERQAELEKRFGLPSMRNNMYVDVASPLSGDAVNKATDFSSSPRLQHRVPIFMEGGDLPIKSSVDSVGSNPDIRKKPNVRVVPIEVEGAGCRPSTTRHRTFSGPAGWVEESEHPVPSKDEWSPLKRSMQDLSQPSKVKVAAGPKVHNIPIHIEGRHPKSEKAVKTSIPKKDPVVNGCASSKPSNQVKTGKMQKAEQEQKVESAVDVALKKIESILEELKSYESGVKQFLGSVKDKQYRYLDEMLTRCMLRLDDIDTMGNDKVRSERKSAVKKVQACIDLLETKVNPIKEDVNSEMQEECDVSKDINMKDTSDTCKENEDASTEEIPQVEIVENTANTCEVQDGKDVDMKNICNKVEGESADDQYKQNADEIMEGEKDVDMKDACNGDENTQLITTTEIVRNTDKQCEVQDWTKDNSSHQEGNMNEVVITEDKTDSVTGIGTDVKMLEAQDFPVRECSRSTIDSEVPEVEMEESKPNESKDMVDESLCNKSEAEVLKNSVPIPSMLKTKTCDVEMEDFQSVKKQSDHSEVSDQISINHDENSKFEDSDSKCENLIETDLTVKNKDLDEVSYENNSTEL